MICLDRISFNSFFRERSLVCVDDVNNRNREEELLDNDVQNAKSYFFSLIELIFRQQSSDAEHDDNEVHCDKDAKLGIDTVDCALE